MSDLKPCPFCGEPLIQPYLSAPDVYKHPETTCFAGRAIVHPENYSVWNARTPDINAAVAQALEMAANVIERESSFMSPRKMAQAIRALTPADANAALEAVKREARADGMREAAELCRTTTMEIPMRAAERQFAGMFCAGSPMADSAKHHGMGYADLILAAIEGEGE